MSKKIKKLIKRHKQHLNYRVEQISTPSIDTLEIKSDHEKNVHKIYIPTTNVGDIEILHELGHASLSETVHPLFSTPVIVGAPSQEMISSILSPAVRAADDWFIDNWLYSIAPDEEKAEIDYHYKMVLKQEPGSKLDINIFLGTALFIAQAEKYLKIKTNVGGDIEKAVNIFTATNPEKPTVNKLKTVINGLLAIYSNYEVEQDGDCWKVITK